MADVKATRASRASMSWATVQSQGASGDQSARRNITFEAQRKTAGPAAIALYARKNPAINPARTRLNVDMVNDGAGGFRETGDIEEVVRYGDERVARVAAKLSVGNRVATTTVYHAPWAYLEPDGTTYQAVDKNGDPKFFASGPREGEPVMLPRYRVKPEHRDEMDRYFAACLEAHADIAPGGHDAIHGYSINLDESRPHLQVLGDPFTAAPSKKNPDALKNGYSKAFGRHPSDGLVPSLDGEGQPVLLADGSAKLVKDTASTKMRRYHAEFKQRMIDQGFAVCRERDEARHDRHLELGDFKDLQHDRAAVEETAEWLADERVAASLDVAAEFEALAERAQELSGDEFEVRVEEARLNDRQLRLTARETHIDTEVARRTVVKAEQLDRQLAEVPEVKRKARDEGLAEGRTEAQAERDAAAAEREAAERARLTAAEHERVTRQAREKALATEREIAERLEATPRYDPQAAEARAPAELIRNLKGLRDQTGEPVLAVAHRMGLENAERQGGRPGGVSKEMFMTETAHQRAARSRRAADGYAERLGQQAQQDRKRGQRQ
ncbi:hypothetical protein [Gordonia alkaliphila]|uniref:DUF2213 domain-containing protein n=1 Tax=Gordonia alkaliphila TaxID=1053547 RepID=A0ABP8YY69_9ACTN